jgi:hypothetical protein
MAEERQPNISQHYRGLEALEPSRELDEAILAAARPARSGRQRWYYSLAAAAVVVFAVALTLHIERERPDAEAPQGTTPPLRLERELRGIIKPANEPESKPAETKPSVPRPAEPSQGFAPDAQPAARDSLASAPAPVRAQESPPAAPRVAAKPTPSTEPSVAAAQARRADEAASRMDAGNAATALARRAPAEMRLRREETLASPSAAAPGLAPAPPPAAAPEKPDRWLERIAELRSRGRHAEADKELAEFRRVYPNYVLSDVMRERVEGR